MTGPAHPKPAPQGTSAATGIDGHLLATATALLQAHHDDAGWCWACHTDVGQLKPYPCDQARWATAVLAQAATDPLADRHRHSR